MKHLMDLWKKYRELICYMFFGAMTTVVNYAVYLPLYHYAHMRSAVSNIFAWIVSVLFAFFTNKPFVFQSHDWSLRTTGDELLKFIGCRLGSGLLETGILLVAVDLLHWNGTVWKILVSVLVVIINYVGSKLLFRKKAD